MTQKCVSIHIQGLVQGVGFRPFVYRLANELNIKGVVENQVNGVVIRALLTEEQCKQFIEHIKNEKPIVSEINSIHIGEIPIEEYNSFSIVASKSENEELITQIAPDIAVCPECIKERKVQEHRLSYPFINCTLCGPRFSIIKGLPYDRKQTTMYTFTMCTVCENEYTAVPNRRFHAQPIACNNCGPVYYASDKRYPEPYSSLLEQTVLHIKSEEVIAVKGIGGYHLVCDALSKKAVLHLREIKDRDTKPFAVMFRDLESIQTYAYITPKDEETLLSWRRPIVLLKQHTPLAEGVNPRMQTLGCMLPYMPLHYDWFEKLETPVLTMTSGNISDLPIAISYEEAEEHFRGKVSYILHHNRDIHNRVDDSVLQVCRNVPCLIRRSRGYVPEPFFIKQHIDGILAFGAERVNTFALGKGNTILQSQYIGDLKNWETFTFYTESLTRFQQLFRFTPKHLVCDLHPDYLSSREAERLAEHLSLPLLRVQHHHAHAVACMAEYGLDEPVIAIVMDGTGLGDDGNSWGGEFFLCDRKQYQRLSHLEYKPLPGGDKASMEPWRMAVSYLHTLNLPLPKGFEERVGEEKINRLKQIIDKGLNTPQTSSAGRLFDAVASLLGICDVSTHQAEAAILLEQQAITANISNEEVYPFFICETFISMQPVVESILNDIENGISVNTIAARFHITLAHLLLAKTKQLLLATGTTKVIISGGCFQNKYLTETLQYLFMQDEILFYVPSRIPCNDSGISIGQLLICHENI